MRLPQAVLAAHCRCMQMLKWVPLEIRGCTSETLLSASSMCSRDLLSREKLPKCTSEHAAGKVVFYTALEVIVIIVVVGRALCGMIQFSNPK